MNPNARTVVVLGLSGTGKTHFGGQLIGRLRLRRSRLRLEGAPSDRTVFDEVLRCLQEGKPAEHTPTTQYGEEVMRVRSERNELVELAWPDYGGEQLAALVKERHVSGSWKQRLEAAETWMLFMRPMALTVFESAASRPRASQIGVAADTVAAWDDNARYVEMLQILLYAANHSLASPITSPRLCIVLSCWDECETNRSPRAELATRLPFFFRFVESNWSAASLSVWGLSSLGRPLYRETPDVEYVARGPEHFGFVVDEDGRRSSDLTELVAWSLRNT